MKRMKMVLVLGLALAFAGMASADPPTVGQDAKKEGRRGGGGFFMPRLLNNLHLSKEQKKQVASILKSHREEIGKVAAGWEEARKGLVNVAGADAFSEEAVRQAARAVADQEEKVIVLRAKIMNEIKQALNEQQKKRLQRVMTRLAGKMKSRMEFRLDALDRWIANHSK